MFEKCGLKDVIFRIYQYKLFICATIVVAALIGVGIYLSGDKGSETEPVIESKWCVSSSYLVKMSEEKTDNSETLLKEQEEALAHEFVAILKSDYSRKAVYEELIKNYTAEEIIDALDLSELPESLSHFSLQYSLNCEVLTGTSIVNFYILTRDKEFSQDYMKAYNDVFENIPETIENSKVKFLGGVADEKKEVKINEKGSRIDSSVIAVAAILGVMVSLLAVFAVAVFAPTINRRADLASYETVVLAEIGKLKGKDGQSLEVVTDVLLNNLLLSSMKSLAVIPVAKEKSFAQNLCLQFVREAEKIGETLKFVDCADFLSADITNPTIVWASEPQKDINALRACKGCDAALLVVQYGISSHKALDEILMFFKTQNVPLMGVVTVQGK